MRTKTTILTAALIAAGIASSMAQSQVYSLNIVGYIQVPLTTGLNLVTAPLVGADFSVNTSLTNIMDSNGVPIQSGSLIQYKTGVGFGGGLTAGGDGTWLNSSDFSLATNTVHPGEGFFISIDAGAGNTTNLTMTLTGSVLRGTNSYAVPAGFSFMGQFEPIVGDITTNNFPVQDAVDNDVLETFNTGLGKYNNGLLGESAANGGPAFLSAADFSTVIFAPALGTGWLYVNKNATTNWTQIVP